MAAIDISGLLSNINSITAPRYKIVNGKRIKFQDFVTLDPFQLSELQTSEVINWDSVDKELDTLHAAWESEIDPIKKTILVLKYDLLIESYFYENFKCKIKEKKFIKSESEERMKDKQIISELQQKLQQLENLL